MEKSWSKIKPIVRHFHVFGSEAWAHIPDEKQKALQPKSEKCIFVRYFEDVKGYRLLQPHSNDIIIRRYFNFDENISTCKLNLTYVPSVAYKPSSTLVAIYSTPKFLDIVPTMTFSFDDDRKDENPPIPIHFPPIGLA